MILPTRAQIYAPCRTTLATAIRSTLPITPVLPGIGSKVRRPEPDAQPPTRVTAGQPSRWFHGNKIARAAGYRQIVNGRLTCLSPR